MSNERYNQIIDDAYKSYVKYWEPNIEYIEGKAILTQEEFLNKCKTDVEFSEKWGLKIEERELSYEERLSCLQNILDKTDTKLSITNETTYEQLWDYYNVPTKLITITYNDIKTEIYE